MKNQFKIALLFFVSCLVARADVRWQDKVTAVHFMLLDGGPMSWLEASRACRKKGWDVFNYEYLSPEEQERFRDSVTLESMRWETKMAGEPGERQESSIWMSSQSGAITSSPYSSSVSYLYLQQFKNESTRRARVQWQGQEDGKRHAACMYQSHTWEGCSHEMVCTFEKGDGGTYNIRFSLYEYGPNQGVIMARLRDRVKQFSMTGGRCELALKDAWCLNYRGENK